MPKRKKNKSFVAKHIIGMCMAIASLVSATAAYALYAAFRGPVESIVATNQVNDSVADFVLHQQMSYNNLVPGIIWALGIIVAILFLLPTIIDGVKLAFSK